MPKYLFAQPEPTSVPIQGRQERFAVRRIYCVGRNYLDHIREMGADEREPPFFFQKPTDAIVLNGAQVPYPPLTADFQYEVELVLAIGRGGSDIATSAAADHVFGLAVGIDLTRRDLQIAARKAGRPWEPGKSFDQSAPIGDIVPLTAGLPGGGHIELSVNGTVKQSADLGQLIWSCGEIVSQLSAQYRLEPGDLIYTGTPAGVGPILPGDKVRASADGLPALEISVSKASES